MAGCRTDLFLGTNSHPRRRSLPPASNSTSRRSTMTIEPLPDIVDRVLIKALIEAARDVADMRCRQQVRQAAERVIRRQRLLVEDVDRGAGDLAASPSSEQIGLNHERPARG